MTPYQEHPERAKDPRLINGDDLARGVAAGRHLPADQLPADPLTASEHLAIAMHGSGEPDDLYRQRTYQALITRGEPVAEAQRKAEFWARLKAADPAHVIGPADDPLDPLGTRSRIPTITIDPITGERTYHSAYQPQAAATGGPAGSPPTILEYSRSWFGTAQPINRFSMNPGAEYYAGIPGPVPSMFAAGDLPIITGSGVDPSILRWIAWPLRHTAALTERRAKVAILIEASLDGDPDEWQSGDLISEDGKQALAGYYGKIATWVQTLPTDENGQPDLSPEEIARFYPDGDGG